MELKEAIKKTEIPNGELVFDKTTYPRINGYCNDIILRLKREVTGTYSLYEYQFDHGLDNDGTNGWECTHKEERVDLLDVVNILSE